MRIYERSSIQRVTENDTRFGTRVPKITKRVPNKHYKLLYINIIIDSAFYINIFL